MPEVQNWQSRQRPATHAKADRGTCGGNSQIPQMYALLKEFRYLVVLDVDAFFAKPDIPLHLLMGHWGWKRHSRCAAVVTMISCAMCEGLSQLLCGLGYGRQLLRLRLPQLMHRWGELVDGD